MTTIQVYHSNSWGKVKFYPANGLASLGCELLDSKSFTSRQIQILTQMGFLIEIVVDPSIVGVQKS